MADEKVFTSVDLTCMKKSADEVLTKNGEKNSVFVEYKGVIEVESSAMDLEGNTIKAEVSVLVKFKSADKSTLGTVVPLDIGAKRKMELSLTNEDLDNHK